MEKAARDLVLKIEGAVIQLEGVVKGVGVLSDILPNCPHEIDCGGMSALLNTLFMSADDAIEAIKEICELTDEDIKKRCESSK